MIMPTDSDANPSLEHRAVNVTLSVLWVLMCAIALILTSLNGESLASGFSTPPITYLLALPALWGLYVWRQYSLHEILSPHSIPQTTNNPSTSNPSTTSPATTSAASVTLKLFDGTSPLLQLTWLSQSLASACLVLIIWATMRPILLASLIAIAIILLELGVFAVYLSKQTRSAIWIRTAHTIPPATAVDTFISPSIPDHHPTVKSEPSTLDKDLDDNTDLHDDNYQTLLALREQIEQSAEPLADDQGDNPVPRQTIRDFRDNAGFGTLSGESLIDIPAESNTTIITLAFMPPFPKTPELLADCEDDWIDSIRVLQCQSLGAKIEIKFQANACNKDTDAKAVTLIWEASLEAV